MTKTKDDLKELLSVLERAGWGRQDEPRRLPTLKPPATWIYGALGLASLIVALAAVAAALFFSTR